MQAALPFPDISPNLWSFAIGGMEFAIRWYALAYIVGIVIAWRLGVRAVSKAHLWPAGRAPMTPRQIEDMLTWIVIGIILGGRLGFVLFYQPAYYAANPGDILKVWQGGMAFHGGFVGVLVAAWIYTGRHGISRLSAADLIAHGVPAGIMLGRLANFINAELWGRPTDVPWGVVFPGEAAQSCGQIAGLCARHPSQLYEAALEGLILGLCLLWIVYRRLGFQKPGLVLGVFLAGYGIARFSVEFVRQPDAQFISADNPLGLAWHIGGYGLTIGQMLSVPMIALGLWFALRAARKPA